MDEQNVQNAEAADAIPQESQTSQEATEDTAAAAPDEQQDNEEATVRAEEEDSNETSADDAPGLPAPFMSFNYNHQKIELNETEAVEWAQKGMHYFNKLDYIAAQSRVTVNELLDKMICSMDEAKREEYREQFGDDSEMIESLMEVYHNKQKERYRAAVADREAESRREAADRNAQIADEFIAMQKDFPELKSLSDIPPAVLKSADNMPLAYAYLLYKQREQNKINAANNAQNAAAASSTGSMSTPEAEGTAREENAFSRGVWS